MELELFTLDPLAHGYSTNDPRGGIRYSDGGGGDRSHVTAPLIDRIDRSTLNNPVDHAKGIGSLTSSMIDPSCGSMNEIETVTSCKWSKLISLCL
jgi:hypothetical protein